MQTIFEEVIINDHKNFHLNEMEIFVSRLLPFGMTVIEISEFLEIEKEETFRLIDNLKQKVGYSTLFETTIQLFKLNVLNHFDYADHGTKRNALIISKSILNAKKSNSEIIDLNQFIYKNILSFFEITKFDIECELSINNRRAILNDIVTKISRCKTDELYQRKYANLRLKLFDILNVDNWYGAYKRMFDLRLNIDNKELGKSVKTEALVLAQEISQILSHSHFNEKEIESIFYFELVNLYNKLQYNYIYSYSA